MTSLLLFLCVVSLELCNFRFNFDVFHFYHQTLCCFLCWIYIPSIEGLIVINFSLFNWLTCTWGHSSLFLVLHQGFLWMAFLVSSMLTILTILILHAAFSFSPCITSIEEATKIVSIVFLFIFQLLGLCAKHYPSKQSNRCCFLKLFPAHLIMCHFALN